MGAESSKQVIIPDIPIDDKIIRNPNKNRNTFEIGNAVKIKSKNIILFGKTGSGKTSFVNKLFADYIPEKVSTYSKTEQPRKHTLLTTIDKEFIVLNIMDTPGFKETKAETQKIRSDQQLMEIIFNCIDENMSNIDVFCIVHNVTDKLTAESMEVFTLLNQVIDADFKKNCVLLLTHAEDKYIPTLKDDLIEAYVKELLVGDNGKIIKSLCQGGIVITGAYSYDQYVKADHSQKGKLEELRRETKEMNDLAVKTLCTFENTGFPSREMERIIKLRKELVKNEKEIMMKKLEEKRRKEKDNNVITSIKGFHI